MTSMNLSTLPSMKNAIFPANYERAKQALMTCSKLDECHQWGDKAKALASYAKQSHDETLLKTAARIKARAIRRCGELLKLYESGGGRPSKTGVVDHTSFPSQKQAGTEAGLSKHQQVTAIRVANVSEEEFEQAVESEDPPTVNELAERGKKSQPKPLVDLEGIAPKDYSVSTRGQGQLAYFAEFSKGLNPAIVIRGSKAREHQTIREHIAIIRDWLDQLTLHLDSKEASWSTRKKI